MPPAQQISDFIIENFLLGDGAGLDPHASLLQTGVVDSTGVMEIVQFLEATFGVHVEDEELIPENLDSIDNIVAYLGRKSHANSGS